MSLVSVWIGGLASRRGGLGVNIPLARARASAVERTLFQRAEDPMLRHSIVARSYGERFSTHGSENSGYYRSVLVVVCRALARPRPRREPIDLRASQYNKFRTRQTALDELIEGVGGALGRFVIDYDTSQPNSPPSNPAAYALAALGFGAGFPVAGNVETDPEHPLWNTFVSPFLTDPRGFTGAARVSGVGVGLGPASLSYSFFRLIPNASDYDITVHPFRSNGWGFAFGASVVQGWFHLEDGVR